MEGTTKNEFVTVQGVGSPVPVGVGGGRAGPSRPLSDDCVASPVGIQAGMLSTDTGTSNRSKRPRTVKNDQPVYLSSEYDRYFLIKAEDESLSRLSPFIIHKSLIGSVGELESVKRLRNGSLLIITTSPKQSERLLKLEKIHTLNINVTLHPSLNFCKGVVSSSDLLVCSEDEILENLSSQGVVAVRRISTKKDGIISPTPSLILTFRKTSLPDRVRAGFLSLRVRPYFPNPLRCYQCQRFGHVSQNCVFAAVCPSCGKDNHGDSACLPPPSCVNCGESHSPRYKGCSVYKEEFLTQKIKTTEKISYYAAKQKAKLMLKTANLNFAGAVKTAKKTVCSISTQCDESSFVSPQASHLSIPINPTSKPSLPKEDLLSSQFHTVAPSPEASPSSSFLHPSSLSSSRSTTPLTVPPPPSTTPRSSRSSKPSGRRGRTRKKTPTNSRSASKSSTGSAEDMDTKSPPTH